ncbi:MAG: AAA family ATPase [Bradyrhizobium sp.]
MKLVRLRLSNFRSFGAGNADLDLEYLTFLLGPNGAGKTAVLQALARMFSLDPAQRKVKKSDFHVPHDEKPEQAPGGRELWIEADFEFPELLGKGRNKAAPAVPGNFAHMQLIGVKGPAHVRFRLRATIDQDDDIEENFTFVIKIDNDGRPLEEGRVAKHDRNAIQVHYLPARRDPTDHISYSANALLGRALRAADWAAERASIADLTEQISSTPLQPPQPGEGHRILFATHSESLDPQKWENALENLPLSEWRMSPPRSFSSSDELRNNTTAPCLLRDRSERTASPRCPQVQKRNRRRSFSGRVLQG